MVLIMSLSLNGLIKLFILFICLLHNPIVNAETLVIGSVSSRPSAEIKRFQPLVNYLKEALKPEGIDNIKLHIASSINEMSDLMADGTVSIYMDSPFPSLQLSNSGVSDMVLRRWKKGVDQYHSVIFVKKDNGITSLNDLKGKIIGFEEEFSTSSYYIPKASMQKENLTLTEKTNSNAKVAANEIGYIFTDDDRNTITWVRKNKVSAGAINNIKFDKIKDKFKKQLKVIYSSVAVPRQVVNFSKKLAPALQQSLKKALLSMHTNDKGLAQLKAFEKTKKFDEFPIPVAQAMAPLSELPKAFK